MEVKNLEEESSEVMAEIVEMVTNVNVLCKNDEGKQFAIIVPCHMRQLWYGQDGENGMEQQLLKVMTEEIMLDPVCAKRMNIIGDDWKTWIDEKVLEKEIGGYYGVGKHGV